ncbi:MAG: hypothetical protein UD575_16295 [Oscillospiraceae bacterium]|nr:hypothetical protein [Oscillospiraceae bacterium]
MEFPKAFRNERLLFLKKSRLLAALEKEITLKVIQLEPQDVKSGIDMLIPLLYDRLPPEIDNTQKVKFTVKL